MTATPISLKFQIGARTIVSVRRRLVRVPFSLRDLLAGAEPELPPVEAEADGYLVTSLPADRLSSIATGDWIALVRQRYTRFWCDLTIGHDAWLAGLSANARSGLKRKTKRLAQVSGGGLDIARARSAGDMATFLPRARAVSATTYQARLLGSGLPDGEAFDRLCAARAATDEARGWLLTLEARPIAYLLCFADGDTLRYDYVGHDPALNDLSPGSVLMAEALRDLFAEARYARFDFTEGEGQHKRQFATGGVACADLLLLRATLANRALVAALDGFDRAMARAKRAAAAPMLKRLAKRVRR